MDVYAEKASFMQRAIAYLIDSLVAILLFVSGASICMIVESIVKVTFPENFVVAISSILGCPYFIFKDLLFNGASIGKKLLRIKIVKRNSYKAPKKIIIILKTLLSLDPISNTFSYYNSKETYSELITNTLVVKKSKYLEIALEKENKGT